MPLYLFYTMVQKKSKMTCACMRTDSILPRARSMQLRGPKVCAPYIRRGMSKLDKTPKPELFFDCSR